VKEKFWRWGKIVEIATAFVLAMTRLRPYGTTPRQASDDYTISEKFSETVLDAEVWQIVPGTYLLQEFEKLR